MIAALIAFAAAVAAALFIEARILRHTIGVPVTGWLTEHVYIPALRAAAVMAFVVAGYPALYGVPELPPLGEALAARGGFPFLLNLMIIAGLLLPVVPPLWIGPLRIVLLAVVDVGLAFIACIFWRRIVTRTVNFFVVRHGLGLVAFRRGCKDVSIGVLEAPTELPALVFVQLEFHGSILPLECPVTFAS
jgi:hypothetical protein